MSRGKALVDVADVDAFRAAMSSANVSVRALAAAAGVSPSLISHLRSTDRARRVEVSKAERIAEALGVEPTVLFTTDHSLAAYAAK